MVANLKQKAAGGIAVIAVALGAGQFMQSTAKHSDAAAEQRAALAVQPENLETVVAGSETPAPARFEPEALRLPKVTLPLTAPRIDVTPAPQLATDPAPTLPTVEEAVEQALAQDPCAPTLDLAAEENAMIGLTLVATCHPNERVVLKHAGLALSAKTTLTGALFTDLPALEQSASVEVMFKDGSSVTANIEVPDASNLRRFGVQWQAQDAFQLHGFENGAAYGAAGDVNGANPHLPAAGLPTRDGFLNILGDSTTEAPLLAEVYTYPADPAAKPEVVIEAAVTETTCGREMLGETIASTGGKVTKADLTVAMPDCDAIGDYLVLNNLVPEMNIASSQ
ncbi:MAG: hypothetical protein ABIQ85_01240 [Cypionkella sp.]